MKTETPCWVIVMDSQQARLFAGSRHQLQESVVFTAENPKNSEHFHDRPGRSFESAAVARHAYDPHTDWQEHLNEAFAKDICRYMANVYQQQGFAIFYLICPAKLLGVMRCYLSAYLMHLPGYRDVEVHGIEKNLAHAKLNEIQAFIDQL